MFFRFVPCCDPERVEGKAVRFLIYFNQPGLTSFPIDNAKMGLPKSGSRRLSLYLPL